MKKIIVLLTACFLTAGVFAQNDQKTDKKDKMDKMDKMHHMKDCIMKKDGKITVMKDGKTMDLTSDMTLENGTVVMKDGTVKTKDGIITTLKEGDYVGMDGTIGNSKTKWSKNKMGRDSTMTNKMNTDSVK